MDYKLIRESALTFFFIFLLSAAGNEAEQSDMEIGENKRSAFETVRSMFSLPSVSTSSYWMKVKTMMNQAQTYFFPPNLDFRSSDEAEAIEGGGAGEKVKVAAVKTWGKSKSTVEDSAKLAGETLQKTAHKVKESLSSEFGGEEEADPRTEL
ncbi:unnamed protein product [Ilex paraguariensis]|uniref:Uncharacterized protein n=1 Tax=Ilex paraguariensis TaxID=185542 RepID=A0ABC8RNG1_9AQUA